MPIGQIGNIGHIYLSKIGQFGKIGLINNIRHIEEFGRKKGHIIDGKSNHSGPKGDAAALPWRIRGSVTDVVQGAEQGFWLEVQSGATWENPRKCPKGSRNKLEENTFQDPRLAVPAV